MAEISVITLVAFGFASFALGLVVGIALGLGGK